MWWGINPYVGILLHEQGLRTLRGLEQAKKKKETTRANRLRDKHQPIALFPLGQNQPERKTLICGHENSGIPVDSSRIQPSVELHGEMIEPLICPWVAPEISMVPIYL